MPTASGFLQAGLGRVLISASAPVIFKDTNGFRRIDEKTAQGLQLID